MKDLSESHWIEIYKQEIPIAKLTEWLSDRGSGAICTFTGTTREWTGSEQTSSLLYECYDEMALSEMNILVQQAVDKWKPNKVVVVHRSGEVAVSEASVFVGVSSAHRAASFEAARFLIDELKKTVPIWKKDMNPDGRGKWK